MIADLERTRSKLNHLSNQEIFKGFLLNYFKIARSPEYICDNQIINHFPTKIIIANSDFTPDLATEYSLQLSEIFGYKIRLATRVNPQLLELAQYNAFFALYQRLGLLGHEQQAFLKTIPHHKWLNFINLKTNS